MWKVGRVFDIDVSLHWTLLLLIAFTGVSAPPGGGLGSVLLISALFGCVLLHELGHSLAARQFGINTTSIVLLPIGGIASLERMPRKPVQELWIAIAGPLVNVFIAGGLFMMMGTITSVVPSLSGWFNVLIQMNIWLVVFNMVPAFPMDGGRVFRSLLALRLPYLQATNIAASVGKIIAATFGLIGLFAGQLMWILVAVFVYFAGSAEARMIAREQATSSWRDQFARNFTRVDHGRDAGDCVQVIWDEVERRYRYAPCSP